ncbi:MAG: transcription elongation factor GreA [Myxococcaceae bacterium]
MADTMPITAAGLRKLKEELQHLKSVERPKISAEIEVARAHGDLKENAEYHAAKEKQSHIEGRIMDINGWIAHAEVIDVSKFKGSDKVVFGATVELLDLETDKKVTYRLIGELEADIKKKWIAVTTPVGRALIGKSIGDTATVQSPAGAREYEITSITFEDVD